MAKCADMRLGQVYVCGDCDLELKVVKECDCSSGTEECAYSAAECCGGQLQLKEG